MNDLTHNIHHYHAKFNPIVPDYFIDKYTKSNDIILDPFCGSGTTLLECIANNRKAIGVDINPLAYLISKAKTTIINPFLLKSMGEEIVNKAKKLTSLIDIEKYIFPNKSAWFTEDVNRELSSLLSLIDEITPNEVRDIFYVLFSSILNTVSNKRKTWNNGYIADNVMPNMDFNGSAVSVFENRLYRYVSMYNSLFEISQSNVNGEVDVVCSNILDFSSEQLFDVVITSPPYPFAVDFAKYHRLSYYWFGYNVNELAERETGSRHKRNRQNSESDFFLEMSMIYKHIFSLVKPKGYFCMTVANTKRNNKLIPFIEWLNDLFVEHNWNLIENTEREIRSQTMAQKRIKTEHMMVYQKGE